MTTLIGADGTTVPSTPGNFVPQIYWQTQSALASGTALTMTVRLATTAGQVILGLADINRNILGQTAAFTPAAGVTTQSLLSGVALTASTSYNIFIAFATERYPVMNTDGTTATIFESYGADSGFTWPTIPSPYPASVNSDAIGNLALYASSGPILIGWVTG